jgi:predicted polyphosphate/ATP-dependent NAD kinase
VSVAVGIIANPAAGRDIRRLVAGASVSGSADKAGMVLRALAGLGAAGVTRALMMPAGDGLSATLRSRLTGTDAALPALEELEMRLTGTAADTAVAVERMRAAGVKALIVLGGDGTHRVVAKACGELPLCSLSTGTNNVFPAMREATVAGLATGLFATGRAGEGAVRREAALRLELPGGETDLALVDVAVSGERFIGARALWRGGDVRELFAAFADPGAVGLSAVAGLLQPLPRGGGQALHVRMATDADEAALTLRVPLAPGLVAPVAIASHRTLELGEAVTVPPGDGCLALDGEREIERRRGETATVTLVPGPLTLDVDAVMRDAAHRNATHTE